MGGLSGQRRGLGATCAAALLMLGGEAGVGVGLPGLLRLLLLWCWRLLRRDLGRGGGGGLLGADHRVVEAGRSVATPATL